MQRTPPHLITHIFFLRLLTRAIASHFGRLASTGYRRASFMNVRDLRGSSPSGKAFAVLCFVEEDRVSEIDIRAIK